MQPPTISYLTDIYFGPGIVSVLCDVLDKHKITRPLVVTDQPLVEMGMVEKLGLSSPVVFDQVLTNPTEQSVLDGLEIYRGNGCDGWHHNRGCSSCWLQIPST